MAGLGGVVQAGTEDPNKKNEPRKSTFNPLPDEVRMIYVGNMPDDATWMSLKDLTKPMGSVEFADVMELGGAGKEGFVRYSDPTEAQRAILNLNGKFMGNKQ